MTTNKKKDKKILRLPKEAAACPQCGNVEGIRKGFYKCAICGQRWIIKNHPEFIIIQD